MMLIGKKLGKSFTIMSLSSVLLITVLSNIGMNVFFTTYLRISQESEDQAITEYTREILEEDGYLSQQDLMSIEHYAFTMNAEVILENERNEVILSTRTASDDAMDELDRQSYMDTDRLSYREYNYAYDADETRTILIGRPKSIFIASPDRDFFLTMNLIYLLSAGISLILGMILRDKMKDSFLRPIYSIRENAKHIEDGKYDLVKDAGSDTVELSELAHSIQNMAHRLEEQEALRKRLTSDISHELRTPLATVNSYLEAFIDGVWEPTDEKLALLQDEIRRLTNLIKDLGDLSYMESGQITLNLEKVNLSEIILNTVERFEPLFLYDEIAIETMVKKNVYISGDTDRLNQILTNVISNALKYSNKDGKVIVSLKIVGSYAVITVKDNGIGIEKKDIPFVFERFYRSDLSRNRSTGGKGIGLTIAKTLVEAHQGDISIESETGVGTSVKIRFPIMRA